MQMSARAISWARPCPLVRTESQNDERPRRAAVDETERRHRLRIDFGTACKLTPWRLGDLPDGVGPPCECPPGWAKGHSRGGAALEKGPRVLAVVYEVKSELSRASPVSGGRQSGALAGGQASGRPRRRVRPSVCPSVSASGWLSPGSGERRERGRISSRFCRSTHSGAVLPEASGLHEKPRFDHLLEGDSNSMSPDKILQREPLVFVRPDPRRA